MDLQELLAGWPIARPVDLAVLSGGTNNRSWSVRTEDGSAYVLRLVSGLADLSRTRYEASLLKALQGRSLSFQLPLPLTTNGGDAVVLFEQEGAVNSIATLCPLLPGRVPERDSRANAEQGGRALAELDEALATVSESSRPDDVPPLSPFGDLAHCHPLVPDPLVAIARLPLEHTELSELHRELRAVMESAPDVYQRLPQQLLHRDCGPSNILMERGRVTAIVDFEFVGMDLRVLDLCVALSWWPVSLMGTGKEWEVIDALGAAYVARFPLSEAELCSIPTILRLRDATSLIYRIGRYLAGQESDALLANRVRHSLWREAWLATNHERLLRHALAWQY